ncbi:MAG: DUF1330 domain-containing protein [Sphingomonadales bacterium]
MIDPTGEQASRLSALAQDEPVIFINLQRYHDFARYPDGYDSADFPAGVSGREAYQRYLWHVEESLMPLVGGRMLVAGPVAAVLIGDGAWDDAMIAEFPSIADAMRLYELQGYERAAVHRAAGLAEFQTIVLLQDQMQRMAIQGAWITRV